MKRDRLEDSFSSLAMNSETSAAYTDDVNIDAATVQHSVVEDCHEIAGGNLSSVENRLVSQSVTLDAIFTAMANKAASALEWEGTEAAEKALKLALKAQQQSANTMKILAEIKQPRHVTIAKQANVAHQQYVDNSTTALPSSGARGENISLPQKKRNELIQIGDIEYATLDTGSTKAPLRIDAESDT